MVSTYKTPGVYVEEISVFPPSIAQVETAVPAFVGYTAKHSRRGEDIKWRPTKIRSLAEFEESFGGAPKTEVVNVNLDANNNVVSAKLKDGFLLYDSLRLFFANGGSKAYIVSVGAFPASTADVDSADLKTGLERLKKEDEPTLLLFPDAALLSGEKMVELQQAALAQAAQLGDRFCILDTQPEEKNSNGDVIKDFFDRADEFRNAIGVKDLKYGAAYGPYLRTNLEKRLSYRDIKGKVMRKDVTVPLKNFTSDPGTVQSINFVEKAISDLDTLDAQLPPGLEDLQRDFLQAEADFKEAIGASPLADAADDKNLLTSQQDAYAAIVTEIADCLKSQLNPIVANTGDAYSSEVTDSSGKPVRFIHDDFKSSASSNNPGPLYTIANSVLALVTHSQKGTGKKVAATVLKKQDLLESDWSAWTDGEQTDYYPTTTPNTVNLDVADNRAAYRANLRAGAELLSKNFKGLIAELTNLRSIAFSYESSYENALVATFPLLKTILDRAKNAVTELPPSGAIAGIYTNVDATRGVHKAPANVSLSSVIGVTTVVSHEEQAELNVDVIAGKSINVIRPFTGKGILVWGARTLAGNDNEWRYISVRRFFNMVEESTMKATAQFVFEPNDANTWTKVKAMIENFLINQWRTGALAGATPEDAFFVKVGLGQTMTSQDILEGRMIVEIGMAAVRPAEFIILRFSHKMQES